MMTEHQNEDEYWVGGGNRRIAAVTATSEAVHERCEVKVDDAKSPHRKMWRSNPSPMLW